jgi:hypothetical protein
MAFELSHLGVGAGELDMAGRQELNILAETLIERVPERPRSSRERELRQVPPLLADATEIDAARTGAAKTLLEQDDAQSGRPQRACGGAARDPAADDRDVGMQALGHEASTRIGIGLTGG